MIASSSVARKRTALRLLLSSPLLLIAAVAFATVGASGAGAAPSTCLGDPATIIRGNGDNAITTPRATT